MMKSFLAVIGLVVAVPIAWAQTTPGGRAVYFATVDPFTNQDSAGANVSVLTMDGRQSALHKAAWAGDIATIQALLAAGADVNMQTTRGRTALHFAAWNGHTTTIQALLTAGANVDAYDLWSRTALHKAARNGHTATVQALLVAGANTLLIQTLPKEPVETLDQLSDESAAALGRVLPRLSRAVLKASGAM